MSDEFFLSLRHCLHHLYGVARTLSWLHFLPLALLALAIFPLAGCGDKHENKPDPVRKVRYVVVGSAQSLPALERTGEIHAHDETTLSFRTGGRILTRSVDIGDRVTAGQLLATLDNTTGQNQLDSATADYEGAKASAQVAALNVSRMQKLMPTGAIARTQLDSARADWLVARALKKQRGRMAKCPRKPRLDAPDRAASRRHHGRERLCGTGCQRRPVRADAGDRGSPRRGV